MFVLNFYDLSPKKQNAFFSPLVTLVTLTVGSFVFIHLNRQVADRSQGMAPIKGVWKQIIYCTYSTLCYFFIPSFCLLSVFLLQICSSTSTSTMAAGTMDPAQKTEACSGLTEGYTCPRVI